jgi:hypothetical protein
MGWDDPESLISTLWRDPDARRIFETLNAAIMALHSVTRTARKGYTAWSRKVQFAAARPITGGRVRVGLAVKPDMCPTLVSRKSESWSERLEASRDFVAPQDIDAAFQTLLAAAWNSA